VRDEAAVSKILLEFSPAACRSVYCSCVSGIPSLFFAAHGSIMMRTELSSLVPVFLFFFSFYVYTLSNTITSLSIYVAYNQAEPHSMRVNRVCHRWIAASIHTSSQPDHTTDPGFVSGE